MPFLKHKALGLCAAALALACGAAVARGQRVEVEGPQRLFAPWSNVALDVDLKGMTVKLWDDTEAQKRSDTQGGGPVREFFGLFSPTKGTGLPVGFLRIHMEPAPAGATAESLRAGAAEYYPKLRQVSRDSIKRLEYGQTPVLRYAVVGSSPQEGMFLTYLGGRTAFPIPYGTPAGTSTYHALEAYVVRDGTAVTLRYTADKIKEEDERLFRTILDSVRFVDAASPSNSFDYLTLGSDLYDREEHVAAVEALEKALALERKERRLTQTQWRHLLMTLANALGAAGQVERARDVLEYGAATEPTYPYFHHGLSKVYSYFGDLDRVLAELEKAYQYEPKGLKPFAGWPIPDPLLDPAFARYKGEPKFRDAVKELKKKYKR